MLTLFVSPLANAQTRDVPSASKPALSTMGRLPPADSKISSQDIQTGYLEVIWEDAMKGSVPERVRVSLVNDSGRFELPSEQAQQAAEDLVSLSGQEVAVYRSPSSGELLAMVPANSYVKSSSSSIAQSSSGDHAWKTIACKFPDVPFTPVSVGFLRHQYGRMRGHIGHYWHAMSYGKLNVRGTAHGWFDLPHPKRHYVVGGSLDTTSVGQDCINAALPSVDFSQTHGINIALNDNIDGFARGGRLCFDFPGARQACTPMTWLPPFGYKSLRTMMHEMGHAYSLPHSDNSDGDSDTYDNYWDVMSYIGWAPQHPILGGRPQYLASWHRYRLGWFPPQRVSFVVSPRFPQIFHLNSVSIRSGSGKHLVVLRQAPVRDREGNISDPNNGVHYTIEARTNSTDFNRNLVGEAVIIHRISHGSFSKPVAVDADVPPANVNRNEGSMFKPGESWTTPEGFGTVRVLSRTPTGFLILVGPAR